jgi:hypothetical protein
MLNVAATTCQMGKLGMFLMGYSLRYFDMLNMKVIITQSVPESVGFYAKCGLTDAQVTYY